MTMSGVSSSGGEFWTAENPDVRVCGVFTAEVGQEPEATLEQGLTAGLGSGPAPAPTPAFKPGDMAGAMRAHAAGSVARFRAITFWGQLETGEPVSVLDANKFRRPGAASALRCAPGGPRCTRNPQAALPHCSVPA